MSKETQPQRSAGLLVYRVRNGVLEVLLGHPGGPYFSHREEGAWGIPKGHVEPGEEAEGAALREFEEETGFPPPVPTAYLGEIRQRGGKSVVAWAAEWDGDEELPPLDSNSFQLEWPPRSGRTRSFPELDQLGFFTVVEARRLMNDRQLGLVDRLVVHLREQGRIK